MCEWTVPASGAGARRHGRRTETPCQDCKDAVNLYRRERRAAGLDTGSQRELWSRYRLRPHEYQRLIAQHGGRCAICDTPFKSARSTQIDHDHACCPGRRSCGKCIRGILCARCNIGIAILDDKERLKRALAYLSPSTSPSRSTA